MTAEPSASVWEVTRLILSSPDGSPSAIAHEHGYSAAEIAELMPIFLDTARTDWTTADAGGWATPAGPGAAEHDAELYLRDLAGSGSIEAVGAGDAPIPGPADAPGPGDELLAPDLGVLLDGADPGRPPAAPVDAPPAVTEPGDGPAAQPADGPTDAGTGAPVDGATGSAPAEETFALGDDPFAGDPFGDPFAGDPSLDDAFPHPADDATSPGFEIDDFTGGPHPG